MLWLVACSFSAPGVEPPVLVHPAPPPPVEPLPETGPFERLVAPGLTLAAYLPPAIADDGFSRPAAEETTDTDPRLYVVTIDPMHYTIRLLSTHDPAIGGASRTAAEWADTHGLHVAFNPGMFEPDGRPTGYTRIGDTSLQPQVRRQSLYRSWFVVGDAGRLATLDHVPPKASGNYVPFGEVSESFRAELSRHTLVSQSLAVMRDGHAVYPPRKNQWSELAYGTDEQGRLVVVFSRFPYEMRELGRRVEALHLGIDALIHGEGGPEASLVVRAGGIELVRMGSYETGFFDDGNEQLWRLPGVLGASPR